MDMVILVILVWTSMSIVLKMILRIENIQHVSSLISSGTMSRKTGQNCAMCIINIITLLTRPIGICLIKIDCVHTKYADQSKFSIERKYIASSALLAISTIICGWIYMINEMKTLEISDDKIFTVINVVVYGIISHLMGFVVIFFCFRPKLRVVELKALTILFRRRHLYQLNTVLSFKDSQYLKSIARTYVYLIAFIPLIMFSLALVEFVKFGQIPIILRWLWIVSVYVFMGNLCCLSITLKMYEKIFESNFKAIRKACLVPSLKIYKDAKDLRLKNLRRFYMATIMCFRKLNVYLGGAVELTVCVSAMVYITDIFLVVHLFSKAIEEEGDLTEKIVFVGIVAAGMVMILQIMLMFEKLKYLGDNILSFLFRYHISKLTLAEAAQVEMLITTLTIQKPILKASEIFTIGTRFIASITGTVVTYVLVALQFQQAWTKAQH